MSSTTEDKSTVDEILDKIDDIKDLTGMPSFNSIAMPPINLLKNMCNIKGVFDFGDTNVTYNIKGQSYVREFRYTFKGIQYKKKLLDMTDDVNEKDMLDTSETSGVIGSIKQKASNLLKTIRNSMKFYNIEFQGVLPGENIKTKCGLQGKQFVLSVPGFDEFGVPDPKSGTTNYILDVEFFGCDNGENTTQRLTVSRVDTTTITGSDGEDLAIVFTIPSLKKYLNDNDDKLDVRVRLVSLSDKTEDIDDTEDKQVDEQEAQV